MVATSAVKTRPRWQWESDSTSSPPPDPGNAPWNCGPTAIAKILEFYKDRAYNVNGVRRAAGVPDRAPTNVADQARMATLLGVPCTVQRLTVTELKNLIRGGRRPVLVGMEMGRIPAAIRGHSFLGAHAVAMLDVNSRGDFIGNDPNFSPRTGRTDPTNGKRVYPASVVAYAMSSPLTQNLCVVPKAAKKIPTVVTAPPAAIETKVGGLPMTFYANRKGAKASIKKGKPRRSGASIGSHNYGNTTRDEPMTIWGWKTDGEDLTKYGLPGKGLWYFGPQYINGKDRVVYVPYCDLTDKKNL